MSIASEEWQDRFSMNLVRARRLVERCFPNLRIKQSKRLLGGWENFVLEVNNEIIFRFPINKETEKRLRTEIELLPKISGHLPVRVPDYEYVWKGDRKHPAWFGGYRKINGVPLSAHTLLGNEKALARAISGFVKQLHGIRLGRNRPRGLPAYSPEKWFQRQQVQNDRIRRIVYPVLPPKLRHASKIFWKKLLEEIAEAHFKSSLIHADLGFENILVSPSSSRLSGVLDWGYAQIGDPALDFSHLIIDRAELGHEVVRLYGSNDPGFRKRVQWYVESEAFFDMMWGIENDWEKAKKKGLDSLTRTLNTAKFGFIV
jgi:aminoglycoside 2''-phosphotransferase